MKLLIIGPQGSGKGTQAKIISQKLEIPHISTGDLFRGLKGDLKKEVDEVINAGNLVPDDLTIKILKQRLEHPDTEKGFILDGFPRNANQIKLLKDITEIDKVIEIDISDEIAVERISSRLSCKKCGAVFNTITMPPEKENICNHCDSELYQRDDDTPESVKKRLKTYHEQTEPTLQEYSEILIKVDGAQTVEEISNKIMEELRK